ncbi:MAG: ADP-ribosylation factor-like protein [Myxococcota bacterium]
MQFNIRNKELTLKVVYYGPALSGKTTNIEALHAAMDPSVRGRLMTLDTKGDRTLFFDLLPAHFQTRSGFMVKLKLFTVPGQVMHESTRRIVLAGCDAVVFIADAAKSQRSQNNAAFSELIKNLKENGLDPNNFPIVIQFNKLDLPDAISERELTEYERSGKEPIHRAVAIRGEGVVETLQGCLQLLWDHLDETHDFKRKFSITQDEFMRGIFQSIVGAAGGAGR